MRLSARAREALLPASWFTALALAVAGPLLSFSGYLLLLDWPSGPRFPRVDFFPDPSTGAIGNTAPLDALQAGLRGVHQYLPDKVFLIAPILLGGIGVYQFVRSRLDVSAWGGILGGTLFVVNPWVIDRYLSGHLNLLLAYSLFPWALLPLCDALRQPTWRGALVAAVWLFAFGVIDIHVAGMYGLLLVVCFLVAPSRRRLLYAGAALGIAALLSIWWVIPVLVEPHPIRVGTADLVVYASRPRGIAVLPTLIAMYGFWRNEFLGPAARVPGLYVLLVPLLGLVTVGAIQLGRSPNRRVAITLGGTAAVGLVLAAGTSFPPTAGVFRWLFDQVVGFRIYREPQKFLALVVLAYGIFVAVGFHALMTSRSRATVGIALVASVATVLAYGYTLLGGLWGQVQLSRYPEEWYAAERVLEVSGGGGRVLVLPWHLYAVWSFSDGRIVANPAPSFFPGEVLIDREAGFESVPRQVFDPVLLSIERIVRSPLSTPRLSDALARIGVRYVLLLREADYWRYLGLQGKLPVLYRGERLVLLENAPT